MPHLLQEKGNSFNKMLRSKINTVIVDQSAHVVEGEDESVLMIPRRQLEQDLLVCTDNWKYAWRHICYVMEFMSERAEECLVEGMHDVIQFAEDSVQEIRMMHGDYHLNAMIMKATRPTFSLECVVLQGMAEHLGNMLFIRHMQVAQKKLLKIFEGVEHLAFMILIFVFLEEYPSVNILPP